MLEITPEGDLVLNFQGDFAPMALASDGLDGKVDALGFAAIEPGTVGRDLHLKGTEIILSPVFFVFNDPKSIDVIVKQLNKVKQAMIDGLTLNEFTEQEFNNHACDLGDECPAKIEDLSV